MEEVIKMRQAGFTYQEIIKMLKLENVTVFELISMLNQYLIDSGDYDSQE